MRFVLLFVGTAEDQVAWEGMSEAERGARYAEVGRWFQTNAPVMRAT